MCIQRTPSDVTPINIFHFTAAFLKYFISLETQQNSQWIQIRNLLSEKTQFTDGRTPSVAESLLYLQEIWDWDHFHQKACFSFPWGDFRPWHNFIYFFKKLHHLQLKMGGGDSWYKTHKEATDRKWRLKSLHLLNESQKVLTKMTESPIRRYTAGCVMVHAKKSLERTIDLV